MTAYVKPLRGTGTDTLLPPSAARLGGFARRWHLRDVHNRGVPEAPGLTLGLEPGFTLEEFRAAMHGHILDEGQIVPTYTLNPALR